MSTAIISACGTYRYHLTRQVGPGTKICTFIMLNPSTADGDKDDPTIRKCVGFAKRWGCAELHVVNLFAYRATDPKWLGYVIDPVGADNKQWVDHAVDAAWHQIQGKPRGPVVCAWGTYGGYMNQDEQVMGWIEEFEPMCLGNTKDGFPRHPLYVPYISPLIPYGGRRHATLILSRAT